MKRAFSLAVLLLAFAAAGSAQMLVSSDWLQRNLSKVSVIDVADKTAYDAGHIPGAVLVEFSSLVTKIDATPNELPPIDKLEEVFRNAGVGDGPRRIVIYSRDPLYATRAWFTLDYLGHGNRASVLDGGYAKWAAESKPISKEAAVVKPATFQAKVRLATLTRFSMMRQLVRDRDSLGPNLVVIDARPPAQFTGEEAGNEVKCGGHIPGAVNIPASTNLTSSEAPVFRSVDELRALYESAGVTKSSANVTYCRTGMQASMTYFVLKYIGYDATLYDGSFVEWSGSGEPIE